MKSWNDIKKEELERLYASMSDSEIAQQYGVSAGSVRYKRKKYGITAADRLYQSFANEDPKLFKSLNEGARERLLDRGRIDEFAKALTHFAFRNGPVEDMHAGGKLTEEDMKTLNKYMVNKLAGLLEKAFDGDWLQIELVLGYLKFYGGNWDKAEPETSEFERAWDYEREKILKALQP